MRSSILGAAALAAFLGACGGDDTASVPDLNDASSGGGGGETSVPEGATEAGGSLLPDDGGSDHTADGGSPDATHGEETGTPEAGDAGTIAVVGRLVDGNR